MNGINDSSENMLRDFSRARQCKYICLPHLHSMQLDRQKIPQMSFLRILALALKHKLIQNHVPVVARGINTAFVVNGGAFRSGCYCWEGALVYGWQQDQGGSINQRNSHCVFVFSVSAAHMRGIFLHNGRITRRCRGTTFNVLLETFDLIF